MLAFSEHWCNWLVATGLCLVLLWGIIAVANSGRK